MVVTGTITFFDYDIIELCTDKGNIIRVSRYTTDTDKDEIGMYMSLGSRVKLKIRERLSLEFYMEEEKKKEKEKEEIKDAINKAFVEGNVINPIPRPDMSTNMEAE